MNGALERGLSYAAFDDMEVGAIVDFVITYNNAHEKTNQRADVDRQNNNVVRSATQDDWERFSSR